MKWISFSTFAALFTLSFSLYTNAKISKFRTTQEVDFSEMSLKGTIRNPDGAYLVQKKSIKFMPLHNIHIDLDTKIREASFYSE